jgi:hypothetical protein
MGAILEAAQRGSHPEVLNGLSSARAAVLGVLPAIAGARVAAEAGVLARRAHGGGWVDGVVCSCCEGTTAA